MIKYGNLTGYVSTSYIRLNGASAAPPAQTTKAGTVNVTSGTLNVRSGPSMNHAVIGSLKKGAAVTVTGTSGTWYTIQYGNTTGYVSTSYIRVS
jgi:N-acetylmuramoyl-L-alanine amidase